MKTGTTETPSVTKAVAHETAGGAHELPPNVKQLQAYQLMANNSPRVQAQAQLQAAANRHKAASQKGPGIVQRTAVYISFDPKKPKELVPGTDVENDDLFFKALRDVKKYTQEKLRQIVALLKRPDASEWDQDMINYLNSAEEEEEEEEDTVIPLSEEEEATTTTPPASDQESDTTVRGGTKKRDRSNSSSPKEKTKHSKKKKIDVKGKAKEKEVVPEMSEEEEEEESDTEALPPIEWNNKTASGTLAFDQQWWVKVRGGNAYGIMNLAAIDAELGVGYKVSYIRPNQDYGPAAKELKKQIDSYGVLVTAIEGADADQTLPAEQTKGIIALQQAARGASQKRKTEKASGQTTYRPSLLKEQYAVKWKQPALSIKGTTHDRTMVKTMDIGYQPTGHHEPLPLPGEQMHDEELYEAESLHGNGINARFSLAYVEEGVLKLATGAPLFFGSGKTTSSVDEKHKKADKIATMLVNSGQIRDVSQYDDGKHAHSEQIMIVSLSKNLDVFDKQLASLAGKTVSIVALVLDMYSNPNTVCERCHPSLKTFFTTTDWKAKVTEKLTAAAVGKEITVAAPDVVIRVSSSKAFSASATQAIPKATAKHTVQQGEHDINFIERVPFKKSDYYRFK